MKRDFENCVWHYSYTEERKGDMIFACKMFTNKVNLNLEEFFSRSLARTRGYRCRVVRQGETKKCRTTEFSNRIAAN